MFNEQQIEMVRKANNIIKEKLEYVKKMHPVFDKKNLVMLIKFKDIDHDLITKLKNKIDDDRTLMRVNFNQNFDMRTSYSKIDFTKLPKVCDDSYHFITDRMYIETEIKAENDNEALKRGFNAVMQEISAVDQIINSPDLVYYNNAIEETCQEEYKLELRLRELKDKRHQLYEKKQNAYSKIISMAEDF